MFLWYPLFGGCFYGVLAYIEVVPGCFYGVLYLEVVYGVLGDVLCIMFLCCPLHLEVVSMVSLSKGWFLLLSVGGVLVLYLELVCMVSFI